MSVPKIDYVTSVLRFTPLDPKTAKVDQVTVNAFLDEWLLAKPLSDTGKAAFNRLYEQAQKDVADEVDSEAVDFVLNCMFHPDKDIRAKAMDLFKVVDWSDNEKTAMVGQLVAVTSGASAVIRNEVQSKLKGVSEKNSETIIKTLNVVTSGDSLNGLVDEAIKEEIEVFKTLKPYLKPNTETGHVRLLLNKIEARCLTHTDYVQVKVDKDDQVKSDEKGNEKADPKIEVDFSNFFDKMNNNFKKLKERDQDKKDHLSPVPKLQSLNPNQPENKIKSDEDDDQSKSGLGKSDHKLGKSGPKKGNRKLKSFKLKQEQLPGKQEQLPGKGILPPPPPPVVKLNEKKLDEKQKEAWKNSIENGVVTAAMLVQFDYELLSFLREKTNEHTLANMLKDVTFTREEKTRILNTIFDKDKIAKDIDKDNISKEKNLRKGWNVTYEYFQQHLRCKEQQDVNVVVDHFLTQIDVKPDRLRSLIAFDNKTPEVEKYFNTYEYSKEIVLDYLKKTSPTLYTNLDEGLTSVTSITESNYADVFSEGKFKSLSLQQLQLLAKLDPGGKIVGSHQVQLTSDQFKNLIDKCISDNLKKKCKDSIQQYHRMQIDVDTLINTLMKAGNGDKSAFDEHTIKYLDRAARWTHISTLSEVLEIKNDNSLVENVPKDTQKKYLEINGYTKDFSYKSGGSSLKTGSYAHCGTIVIRATDTIEDVKKKISNSIVNSVKHEIAVLEAFCPDTGYYHTIVARNRKGKSTPDSSICIVTPNLEKQDSSSSGIDHKNITLSGKISSALSEIETTTKKFLGLFKGTPVTLFQAGNIKFCDIGSTPHFSNYTEEYCQLPNRRRNFLSMSSFGIDSKLLSEVLKEKKKQEDVRHQGLLGTAFLKWLEENGTKENFHFEDAHSLYKAFVGDMASKPDEDRNKFLDNVSKGIGTTLRTVS